MKKYIIPVNKRKKFEIIIAAIGVVLFFAATCAAWWLVATGGWNGMALLLAAMLTVGLGCSLMALITGRMAWLLVGVWEIPF